MEDFHNKIENFDNKENTFLHTNVTNEAADVSAKLRYSMSPLSSPMSKSVNASDPGQNPAIMTQSLQESCQSETILKPLALKSLALDSSGDCNRISLKYSEDSTHIIENKGNNSVLVTLNDEGGDNLSIPSASSSLLSTPASTPTQEIPKPSSSPILRGLKNVLNMFRPSQSPITIEENQPSTVNYLDDDLTKMSTPVDESNYEIKPQLMLVSTPIASTKKSSTDVNVSKANMKESVVFTNDLVNDLQWNDDSTILFGDDRIPIHKIFPEAARSCEPVITMAKVANKNELDMSYEPMDISYNDCTTNNKTIAHEKSVPCEKMDIDNDSIFLDCETTFNATQHENDHNEVTEKMEATVRQENDGNRNAVIVLKQFEKINYDVYNETFEIENKVNHILGISPNVSLNKGPNDKHLNTTIDVTNSIDSILATSDHENLVTQRTSSNNLDEHEYTKDTVLNYIESEKEDTGNLEIKDNVNSQNFRNVESLESVKLTKDKITSNACVEIEIKNSSEINEEIVEFKNIETVSTVENAINDIITDEQFNQIKTDISHKIETDHAHEKNMDSIDLSNTIESININQSDIKFVENKKVFQEYESVTDFVNDVCDKGLEIYDIIQNNDFVEPLNSDINAEKKFTENSYDGNLKSTETSVNIFRTTATIRESLDIESALHGNDSIKICMEEKCNTSKEFSESETIGADNNDNNSFCVQSVSDHKCGEAMLTNDTIAKPKFTEVNEVVKSEEQGNTTLDVNKENENCLDTVSLTPSASIGIKEHHVHEICSIFIDVEKDQDKVVNDATNEMLPEVTTRNEIINDNLVDSVSIELKTPINVHTDIDIHHESSSTDAFVSNNIVDITETIIGPIALKEASLLNNTDAVFNESKIIDKNESLLSNSEEFLGSNVQLPKSVDSKNIILPENETKTNILNETKCEDEIIISESSSPYVSLQAESETNDKISISESKSSDVYNEINEMENKNYQNISEQVLQEQINDIIMVREQIETSTSQSFLPSIDEPVTKVEDLFAKTDQNVTVNNACLERSAAKHDDISMKNDSFRLTSASDSNIMENKPAIPEKNTVIESSAVNTADRVKTLDNDFVKKDTHTTPINNVVEEKVDINFLSKEIDFDNIDNPFATKTIIRMSPPPQDHENSVTQRNSSDNLVEHEHIKSTISNYIESKETDTENHDIKDNVKSPNFRKKESLESLNLTNDKITSIACMEIELKNNSEINKTNIPEKSSLIESSALNTANRHKTQINDCDMKDIHTTPIKNVMEEKVMSNNFLPKDIDFDNIDNPFSTKTKIRMSPSPEDHKNSTTQRNSSGNLVEHEHTKSTVSNYIESEKTNPENLETKDDVKSPNFRNIEPFKVSSANLTHDKITSGACMEIELKYDSEINKPDTPEKKPAIENFALNTADKVTTQVNDCDVKYTHTTPIKNAMEEKVVGNNFLSKDIDFDNIDNPFSTKTKMRTSPPPPPQTSLKYFDDVASPFPSKTRTHSLIKEKDLTFEVHTEDEDTIEGPFFEADLSFPDVINLAESSSKQLNKVSHPEIEDKVNDEMFIDADAFEFLMNKASDDIACNGKESLFLKFDPLCANKLSAEGVSHALSNYRKKLTPKKTSPVPNLPEHNESQITLEAGDNMEDSSSALAQKPVMAVIPAVNLPKTKSPPRSARQSMSFASPAIAVIDRLLSLTMDSSMHETALAQSREQSEAETALLELRELLAEKEEQNFQLKSENIDLQNRLTSIESQITRVQTDNEKRMKKIDELNNTLNEKAAKTKNMEFVVCEYERTISTLISELEQEKRSHADEKMSLVRDRDEQTSHLASMEVSFSDLHSKYEKSKQVILTFKSNQDEMQKSNEEFAESLKKMQNNYEMLKEHATAKLNHANVELEKLNKMHKSEVLKLNAMIKRKELHITSLEETLAQKTKANEELTAICDELISKVG